MMFSFRIILVVSIIAQCVCMSQSRENEEITFDMKFAGYPRPGDIPLLNRKIVRGRPVTILEHPYMISVRRLSCHFLTGTLIAKNLVLTVAHPLIGIPIYELGVVAGENYSDRGSHVVAVVVVVTPRQFDRYTLTANLALLLLYESMPPKPAIKIVNLVRKNFSFDNLSVPIHGFVTGWGRCEISGEELCLPRENIYYPDEYQDPMLKTIRITLETSDYCDAYDNHELVKEAGTLCLGEARPARHAAPCLAVPGAPLVTDGRLLAVQSWGFGCGYSHDMPLIYTDLRYYTQWIIHNLNVLLHIRREQLSKLFRATKACWIKSWLAATRAKFYDRFSRRPHDPSELTPWEVDFALAMFDGNVLDMRDFIFEGTYHKAKAKMFEMIRNLLTGNSTGMSAEAARLARLQESVAGPEETPEERDRDEDYVQTTSHRQRLPHTAAGTRNDSTDRIDRLPNNEDKPDFDFSK